VRAPNHYYGPPATRPTRHAFRTELRAVARDAAPLLDRLGRVLADLAPHVAEIARQPSVFGDDDSDRDLADTDAAQLAVTASSTGGIAVSAPEQRGQQPPTGAARTVQDILNRIQSHGIGADFTPPAAVAAHNLTAADMPTAADMRMPPLSSLPRVNPGAAAATTEAPAPAEADEDSPPPLEFTTTDATTTTTTTTTPPAAETTTTGTTTTPDATTTTATTTNATTTTTRQSGSGTTSGSTTRHHRRRHHRNRRPGMVDDSYRQLVATPTRAPHLYAPSTPGNIDIHIHAILTPLRNGAAQVEQATPPTTDDTATGAAANLVALRGGGGPLPSVREEDAATDDAAVAPATTTTPAQGSAPVAPAPQQGNATVAESISNFFGGAFSSWLAPNRAQHGGPQPPSNTSGNNGSSSS